MKRPDWRVYAAAAALLFIGLVLLAGCIKGPTYSYDMSLSDPYNVSGVVELRVNATANVLINNSGRDELRFKVEQSVLSAAYPDGRVEKVYGNAPEGSVPKDGTYLLKLEFGNIPVKYALVDNPPRFHPLIEYYDVNVTSSGWQKILFVWSPSQRSTKSIRIPLKDMPLQDYLKDVKESLSLEENT
ncbi:MAG: hypothetical protein V1875_00295 [Candidatus Altiarchaeota archaeon]